MGELKPAQKSDDTILVRQGNNNKPKVEGMSIKVTGTPQFRPTSEQSKRVKKNGPDFEDALKKAEPPKSNENSDSVKISGNPTITQNGYQALISRGQEALLEKAGLTDLKALSSKVLQSEEEINLRVQEIKDLIDRGGAKAYLDSIDSEKVADRLLNSGVLDDIV